MHGTPACSGMTQRRYSPTRTDRYVDLLAKQRICKLCRAAVEDEVHFRLTCSTLVLPHILLLQTMDSITTGFKELFDGQITPQDMNNKIKVFERRKTCSTKVLMSILGSGYFAAL